MQTEELRIGNWVYNTHNIPMIVKTIGMDYIYVDFENNPGDLLEFNTYNPFKPIPLTEEILLKCGFLNLPLLENHFYIKGMLIWKCEEMFMHDKTGVQLKHLHQLQNLIYALTNQELNIEI